MYDTTLLQTELITHNVKRYVVSRPPGYHPLAGQATELAINEPNWKNQKRPFTFTSLEDSEHLEFIIKSYPKHQGVTQKLFTLSPGAEILIDDPFTTYPYKGPGVFIAGGAGITPFIALLRKLHSENRTTGHSLIFSNKTQNDIILESELKQMLNTSQLILTLTQTKVPGYEYGYINYDFLKKHIPNWQQNFYICGPKAFTETIVASLEQLGVNPISLVFD